MRVNDFPITPSKPRLDGRCEWNRGGLAYGHNANGGLITEYVEACREPTDGPKTSPWCKAHRCAVDGCDLARVVGDRCVGHMPGSIKSQRVGEPL